MTESTKHDAIYLQVCDDEDSEWYDTVTWCQERVHESDVKYIRADLVESLRQQLAEKEITITNCHDVIGYREAKITELEQQLIAALAAIKLKNDAFKEISGDCGTSIAILNRAWSVCEEALAIQSDDAALQAFAAKVREHIAASIQSCGLCGRDLVNEIRTIKELQK